MTPDEFIHHYANALGTQQWESVALFIHPDCTVTFSNGTYHRGKEAVQSAFQRNFDLIKNEKYSISEVHWITKSERFAVYTFTFSWSGSIRGEKASGIGRGTSTLIHGDEGWQLISEHLGPKS